MHLLRDDVRRGCTDRRAQASARPARLVGPVLISIAIVVAASMVLSLTGVPIGIVIGVAVATALTTALVAHRANASLLAGIVLLVVRPYTPGERIRLYAPERGGEIEAEIVRVGLLNTALATDGGLLLVPNTRLLRSAP